MDTSKIAQIVAVAANYSKLNQSSLQAQNSITTVLSELRRFDSEDLLSEADHDAIVKASAVLVKLQNKTGNYEATQHVLNLCK